MTDSDKISIVLVHGAWADGSNWDDVVPTLLHEGLRVCAVQNPLTSLAADVEATVRAIDRAPGKVLLVGHSWGGVVITEAGMDSKVVGLVYVAAFGPDSGEVIGDLGKPYPPPPAFTAPIVDAQGFMSLPTDAVVKHFASDLPEAEARIIAATQGPINVSAFASKVSNVAWKTKPSWYVLTRHDHMIDPALQAAMAEKISAHIVSVPTSHVPQMSKPAQVANAIIAAAGSAK